MSKDHLEEYICDQLENGIEVTADDFEGRQCFYCGEMVSFVDVQQDPDALVTWDVQVLGDPNRYHRDYFCSEECKSDAMRDPSYLAGGSEYGDSDVLKTDDLEANR
jgi:hypothetical protein